MRLTKQGLLDRKAWENKGYELPEYNRENVIENTKEAPYWIHLGAGNIFRAFQANLVQRLLNQKEMERGIIVAEGYDYDIIQKMDQPHDNYTILVTLKQNGTIEKKVIGSIAEALVLDSKSEDFIRLKEIFREDSLQMCSFTITEKGYVLKDDSGNYGEQVQLDLEHGPGETESYLGKVVTLLYERYQVGQKPIAMVSMDNCSHNGDLLKASITDIALEWKKRGLVEQGFIEYLEDDKKVSFPWTMIDKITPRPDASIMKSLEADGIEGFEQVITSKNTYIAPFVNAEECEYLVIEDKFPNGRPPLEKVGVLFADQQTVDKVEKMKVCTCLNPIHTALAVFGCLLGYQRIADEMKNPYLRELAYQIGYVEGLPVVENPKILNPEKFLEQVLTIRIPNPFMPDTPMRIATDTSMKIPIRYGKTIQEYEKRQPKSAKALKAIPLVLAGWLRYLLGYDDDGNTITISADPNLPELRDIVKEVHKGQPKATIERILEPLLRNKTIFGVDLYQVGLANQVVDYFEELIAGEGAVASVLKKYIGEGKEKIEWDL